ncbi:hypothetical protein BaRGS_00032474 [Batillaria attramentaria]|uniref:Uncharacterized protein n=1 Tax=Batillaria attramentaria TaxID=370345 RepID=A0ABD0JNI5_9CAEN
MGGVLRQCESRTQSVWERSRRDVALGAIVARLGGSYCAGAGRTSFSREARAALTEAPPEPRPPQMILIDRIIHRLSVKMSVNLLRRGGAGLEYSKSK